MDQRKNTELSSEELEQVVGGTQFAERYITCPHCQQPFQVGGLDKTAICPNCGETVST